MNEQVGQLVAELSKVNQANGELSQAINQARELVESERYAGGPEAIAPLLWALKEVLDREPDLDEAVLDQACDVLVQTMLSLGRQEIELMPSLKPLLEWFAEQHNYDGRVLRKSAELAFRRRGEWLTGVIASLKSPAPSEVRDALAQASVDRHEFMAAGPIVTAPVLWALKDVVDRRESVGQALADEARELLLHVLWWDQQFIVNAPELADLYTWYHQQPDAMPLERLHRRDRRSQAGDS